MKSNNIYKLICFGLMGILMYSCTPEQEVAPIDSPDDNPVVTIEPMGDYSAIEEGDTLMFSITLDKMISHAVGFDIILEESSVAESDDFEIIGGTLGAYSLSAEIGVIALADATPEPGESLVFRISSEDDIAWNFQLNPSSDVENVSVTIDNYDYSLDWSEGTFVGGSLCEDTASVDLDMYLFGDEGSEFGGATAACPVEMGEFSLLPDGTYDIYVDYYASEIPEDEGVDIPYVASIMKNMEVQAEFTGSFNSDDQGESRVVGQLVISGGSYTVLDDEGTEIASFD